MGKPPGGKPNPDLPDWGMCLSFIAECFDCGATSEELHGRRAANDWLDAHTAVCHKRSSGNA